MIRGGVDPALLDEAAWWREDDLWFWSLEALVTYVRAAAERTGLSAHAMCQRIAARHELDLALPGWRAQNTRPTHPRMARRSRRSARRTGAMRRLRRSIRVCANRPRPGGRTARVRVSQPLARRRPLRRPLEEVSTHLGLSPDFVTWGNVRPLGFEPRTCGLRARSHESVPARAML